MCPYKPCMVCEKHFPNLEGIVVADNFAEKLKNFKKCNFVDIVVREYCHQFKEFFGFNYDYQGVSLKCERTYSYNDILKIYEQAKHMADYHKHFSIFLLAHKTCIPVDVSESNIIELKNIDSGKRAVDWYVTLIDEPWFNPKGYARILDYLFDIKKQ